MWLAIPIATAVVLIGDLFLEVRAMESASLGEQVLAVAPDEAVVPDEKATKEVASDKEATRKGTVAPAVVEPMAARPRAGRGSGRTALGPAVQPARAGDPPAFDPWSPTPDDDEWLATPPLDSPGPDVSAEEGPTEAPPPPEAPLPPVVASDLRVEEVGPFSAAVRFTTNRDVTGVVGFGWGGPVSYASGAVASDHRIELEGLVPNRQYVVAVASHAGDGRPQVSFSTPSRPLTPSASIADGRVELDGHPFFPVTTYGACGWTLENLLTAGVNVFKWEHSCGREPGPDGLLDSIRSLANRAYWTVPVADRSLASDGMIGFTQIDEPDALGLSPLFLPDVAEPGKVTFLTLTQHFALGTGALPWQSPGYYEGFIPKADVLGVDFYPLQGLCQPEKLALNHDVQAELVRLSGGKPTLQWIEAASMNCPERSDAAITAETIRVEMMLAVAGGANGLGVFPARLDQPTALAFRTTLDTIEQAWPMLLTPRVAVNLGGDGGPLVRASARLSGGATMLVVANADRTHRAPVDITVDGLDGRRLVSIDRPLEVTATDDVVHLELAPLESHILVAEPPSP